MLSRGIIGYEILIPESTEFAVMPYNIRISELKMRETMMSKIEKVCPVCGSNIALEEESIDGASAAEICPKSGAQWKSSESEENPDISRQDSALQEKKLAKNKKRRPSLIEYFVRSVIKKFADCSGRASRREFWGTQIYLTFFLLILAFFVASVAFFIASVGIILPDFLISL